MKPTTRIALEWAIRCFGRTHVYANSVRALRCAEEAIELAQSCRVPKDKVLLLVETVYSRPAGGIEQELGGVALTATVYAASFGEDLDYFLEAELLRVLAKPAEHFAKRNQDKIDLGLTGNDDE